jgi:hypothetical protein
MANPGSSNTKTEASQGAFEPSYLVLELFCDLLFVELPCRDDAKTASSALAVL